MRKNSIIKSALIKFDSYSGKWWCNGEIDCKGYTVKIEATREIDSLDEAVSILKEKMTEAAMKFNLENPEL